MEEFLVWSLKRFVEDPSYNFWRNYGWNFDRNPRKNPGRNFWRRPRGNYWKNELKNSWIIPRRNLWMNARKNSWRITRRNLWRSFRRFVSRREKEFQKVLYNKFSEKFLEESKSTPNNSWGNPWWTPAERKSRDSRRNFYMISRSNPWNYLIIKNVIKTL